MLPSSTPGAARRSSCEWCCVGSRVWATQGPPSVPMLAYVSCQRELAGGNSLAGSAYHTTSFQRPARRTILAGCST